VTQRPEDPFAEALVAKTMLAGDGSFEFTGLADGAYSIQIATAAGDRFEHEPLLVVDDACLTDVQLRPVAVRWVRRAGSRSRP
jgi:hypothetical protein